MGTETIFLYIISIVTAYISYNMVRSQRDFNFICYAGMIMSISFWALGLGLFISTNSVLMASWFAKIYYIAAMGIISFFLLFTLSFPNSKPSSRFAQIFVMAITTLLAMTIAYTDGFILKDIIMSVPKKVEISMFGYLTFSSIVFVFLCWAYVNLVLSYYKNIKNVAIKKQLSFIIKGSGFAYVFGLWFNLVLPVYNYSYIWAGPIFGLILVMVVLYGIYRHKLFDTKVITVELFTFTLWLFIFLRAIISSTRNDQVGNFVLLVPTTIIGVFLVRSVRQEIKARNQIEKLAEDLEEVNVQLRKIDEQKSEFVSLASHRIRGPLATIKGYSSMVSEGDFGEITPAQKEAVQTIFQSTENLVTIVGDYLDISSIEQGKMQYAFSIFNLEDLVKEVVESYKPMISKAGLNFSYRTTAERHVKEDDPGIIHSILTAPQKESYKVISANFKPDKWIVNADKGKIRQVISNIIDNSIKYTPHGHVNIELKQVTGIDNILSLELVVSDTGVGIHPDVIPKLFQKFTRAPDASKTNIIGTGLGLYVAKEIIEAHHGDIWATSPGLDKGSAFHIRLVTL
jgi:signal transduction histidine kinase